MIQLSKNASGRLDCHFSDTKLSKAVLDYISNELGFVPGKPIHDAALTQLYIDCVRDNFKLVYGCDEWFDGFFIFAWNAESDIFIQNIYDEFN